MSTLQPLTFLRNYQGTGMQPTLAASSNIDDYFGVFTRALESGGPRSALAYLLALTNYRFIGIFRFQDGKANAVVHYDSKNPSVLSIMEVPDFATYCCYVRDTKGLFTTVNSMSDSRLAAHPARETVLAYCGLPILDAEGGLLGTLCYYDVEPRDSSQLNLDLLLRVTGYLARGAHVPPYPQVHYDS
jgi:GAF domain-containing protein